MKEIKLPYSKKYPKLYPSKTHFIQTQELADKGIAVTSYGAIIIGKDVELDETAMNLPVYINIHGNVYNAGTVGELLDDTGDISVEQYTIEMSGSIVSFTDTRGDHRIDKLTAQIVPKQSGSGDPSPDNIRPISGWSGVNVYETGVNVWDEKMQDGYWDTTDGNFVASVNWQGSKNYIPIKPNTSYFIYGDASVTGSYGARLFYDANKNYLGSQTGAKNVVFTTPANAHYMTFYIGNSYIGKKCSINYPSTDTEYHPYVGESKYIPFKDSNGDPITVYGGTLNVTTGKLTIEKVKIILGTTPTTGTPTAYDTGVYIQMPCPINDINRGMWNIQNGALPIFDRYGGNISKGYSANNYTLFFNEVLTKTEIDSMLANAEMVYKLKTPTEIQLTPAEIRTLKGVNNVWVDTGDAEVVIEVTDEMFPDVPIIPIDTTQSTAFNLSYDPTVIDTDLEPAVEITDPIEETTNEEGEINGEY